MYPSATLQPLFLSSSRACFPKALRLLKSKDFKFQNYERFHTPHFLFVYTTEGHGRLGISIAKKVLKRSVARNRIRRLIREVYRLNHQSFLKADLHVIAKNPLASEWEVLSQRDVQLVFESLMRRL